MKQLIFVSGLPRSCSTLLCNLLAQHPDVHAVPTSFVYDLAEHARKAIETMTAKATPPEDVEKIATDFVRGGVLNAFNSVTDLPVVTEKSRAWVMSPDLLFYLFPDAKLVVPVRDIRSVITSLEKKHRQHPVRLGAGEDASWVTQEGRVNGFLKMIGGAIQGVHETASRFRSRVKFVHAEDLTAMPSEVMSSVWDYLSMTAPDHDFDNVVAAFEEIDVGWPYGDHVIRPKVEPLQKEWNDVLGRQLSEQLKQKFDWINAL